jgi:uncharacterized SAM-binding protein YcdF (DUF218 family)
VGWLTLGLILCATGVATWLACNRSKMTAMRWRLLWLLPLAEVALAGWSGLRDADARRLFAQLMMPAGLIWMALIVSTLWAIMHARFAQAWWCFAVLAAYSLAGSDLAGSKALATLEARVPLIDVLSVPPFEAVFVLGGGVVHRPDAMPELGPSGDRLLVAALLYLQGRTKMLVLSGDFAADESRLLQRLGVPEGATIVISEPQDTGAEIISYKALLDVRGWKRAGLVSSAWHLPRALRLCARNGFYLEPLPSDWRGARPDATASALVPQALGFTKTQHAAWEYLGMWSGR